MYKHKTNNRGRVIDKFSSTKMRVMSKVSGESRMVKSFCSSVVRCFSGNGIMGFASGQRMFPHNDEVATKTWLLKFAQQDKKKKKKKKYQGSPKFSLERVKETTMWSVKILMKKHGLEWQYRVWEPGVVTGGRVGSGEGKRGKWKYKGEMTIVHVDDEEDAIAEYSIFIAKSNPMQLKYDQMLEWGPEGYAPSVVTSTQWRKTGIRVDMNQEQPVEFTGHDYIDVTGFTWDRAGDASKRNQQREPNENLFALDVIYVLFGASSHQSNPSLEEAQEIKVGICMILMRRDKLGKLVIGRRSCPVNLEKSHPQRESACAIQRSAGKEGQQ